MTEGLGHRRILRDEGRRESNEFPVDIDCVVEVLL